jgi:MFS family permease
MPAPVVLAAFGALLVSLDASLNIALPAVAAAFGIGPAAVRWMIICYVATYALTALGAGILADRLGALRVFTAGLWLSAIVFAAYWLAPSYAATLACRVAQGVSGGLIYGTASALVTQSLPRERYGRGLGVMSLGLGVGVAVGPVIGGLLVDGFGWRAVFLYRAPLALALGAVAARFLGRSVRGGAGELRRLALVDIARLAVLRPAVLAFLATFAQFSVWLLIPFYLVSARAIGASLGGMLFTLSPLGTALAAPLAGWAADRLGTRWPIVIGLGIETLGLVVISRLAPDSPLVAVVAGLLLVGFGVGVFQVPNLTEMMAAFPRAQQGAAGGLAFLGRALGSAAGVQVTAALFDARRAAGAGFMSAFESAFLGAALVAGLAALIALAPALVRGRGPRLAL